MIIAISIDPFRYVFESMVIELSQKTRVPFVSKVLGAHIVFEHDWYVHAECSTMFLPADPVERNRRETTVDEKHSFSHNQPKFLSFYTWMLVSPFGILEMTENAMNLLWKVHLFYGSGGFVIRIRRHAGKVVVRVIHVSFALGDDLDSSWLDRKLDFGTRSSAFARGCFVVMVLVTAASVGEAR
jgi:hypothetical protein